MSTIVLKLFYYADSRSLVPFRDSSKRSRTSVAVFSARFKGNPLALRKRLTLQIECRLSLRKFSLRFEDCVGLLKKKEEQV